MSGDVRFLANPSSGRGTGPRVLEALGRIAAGHGAALESSRDLADFRQRVRDAVRAGCGRLIVVGGDGSVYHALPYLAGSATVLGLVPTGSGNDLARSLGLPRDPLRAAELALAAPPRTLDLGRIAGLRFATVAGVGFHGEVASRCSRVRGRRGALIYPRAVLGTLSRYDPPRFAVRWDGGSFEGPAWLVVAANTPCFGGGMRIAPDAAPDDGLLDVLLVRRVSALRLLAVFPRVYSGRHLGHPAVLAVRTSRVTVETDRPCEWWGDGERMLEAGRGPVEVGVTPAALNVAAAGANP